MFGRAFLVAIAALVLAPMARAALPGVHQETKLEAAASFVAGKPVSVYCGDDAAGWANAIAAAFAGFPSPGPLGGFAIYRENTEYLSPRNCGGVLESASRASPAAFGPALFALIHEAVHLSGVTDEWAADCTALSDTWSVAWIYFAVRQPELSRVHEFALRAHLAQPAEYVRAGSC
jgi:hypothetical protein